MARHQEKAARVSSCAWAGQAEGHLFKGRDQLEAGHGGPAALAAALTHAQIAQPLAETPAEPAQPTLSERLDALRIRLEVRLARADWTPDLADEIGSARWFRGLATMLGLSVLALSFWPDLSALEAAQPAPLKSAERDEFRSQMIMPLALGADSGRHMGADNRVVPLAFAPERPSIELVATLGQGDSFGRMLQRAGVGANDAAQVSAMVAGAVPLDEIGAGTRFKVVLGRRDAPGVPRPLEKLAFRARFDLALEVSRPGGGLVLDQRAIAVDATPLRIRGMVGPSLYRSARAAGAPVKAIQQYLQAIGSHISLEDEMGPDTLFDMVVSYKRSATGESEVGQLQFAGLEVHGRPRAQLLRWGQDGQFFEASGMGRPSTSLFAPVAGRITSLYGLRRHPVLGYTRMHAGMDFGAGFGTPIHAVSDAVVSYAGRHGGHGNYVRLEHGGGTGTGYAHMSRIAVSPGARVRAGQVIGYVGSTGLSTGPHLHYEVYKNGRTVNPMGVRFAVAQQVDAGQLAAFKARLAGLKALKPGAAFAPIAPKQGAGSLPQRESTKLGN